MSDFIEQKIIVDENKLEQKEEINMLKYLKEITPISIPWSISKRRSKWAINLQWGRFEHIMNYLKNVEKFYDDNGVEINFKHLFDKYEKEKLPNPIYWPYVQEARTKTNISGLNISKKLYITYFNIPKSITQTGVEWFTLEFPGYNICNSDYLRIKDIDFNNWYLQNRDYLINKYDPNSYKLE